MDRTPQTVVLSLIALLLLAILATLVAIAWRGVRVDHTGTVTLDGMVDAITLEMSEEPVTIQMPEPGHLIATGPTGTSIPVDLAMAGCPECGGPMIPVRWNLWTGEIEWGCPVCGAGPAGP